MEVLGLTWDDVNLEKKAIRLWTRKTSDGKAEGTWLPISEDLVSDSDGYLEPGRDIGYLSMTAPKGLMSIHVNGLKTYAIRPESGILVFMP